MTKITITFKNLSTANLKVNGVVQSADYSVVVYYGQTIKTTFDGVNNVYSYSLTSINNENITITYNPKTSDKWVSVFNLPLDNGVSSREQPTWKANDEDLGGAKTLTITPTIELKVYDGTLD